MINPMMRGIRRHVGFVALIALVLAASGTRTVAAQTVPTSANDVIRVTDSLTISVVGQPSLTGTYSVDGDGSILLPLVGVTPAANLTVAAFTEFLQRRLDAFVRNPEVRVELRRSARIFVLGEVKVPGEFPLTDGLTIIEILAQAGYTGSGEVLIVRRPGAVGPVLPDAAAPSNVIRVNVRDLEKAAESGDLSANRRLEANDTIFVPKIDPTLVYVEGHVRKPGPYSIPDGTTVLQAVTLAGGPTDDAALNSVRVTRLTEGGRSRRTRLTDVVKPGDAIAVPESFQIPSIISVPADTREQPRAPFRILLGSNVALTPSFDISRVGADTTVFAGSQSLQATPLAMFGPSLGLTVRSARLSLDLSGRLGMAVFPGHESENSLQPAYSLSPSVKAFPWLTFRGQYSVNYTRERWNSEIDLLARRREQTESAGFSLGPFSRVRFQADVTDWRVTFDPNQILYGVSLQQTLTERVRSVRGSLQIAVTSQSTLTFSGSGATHRFPLFPERDANATEFAVGVSFKPTATITGEAQVSWLRYLPFDNLADPYEGPAGRLSLSRSFWKRTAAGVLGERVSSTSFDPQFAFGIVDRAGAWVQQVLSRRFDVVVEAFGEHYSNRQFKKFTPTSPLPWADSDSRRYTSQLGVRVGRARIAATVSGVQRLHPMSFQGLLFWVDVSYGVFQVRNR